MFVNQYRPRIVKFSKLPRHCKLAVIWWMAVDLVEWEQSSHIFAAKKAFGKTGGSWKHYTKLVKAAVVSSLGFYTSKYGYTLWGTVSVPLQEFMDGMVDATGGFDSYHNAYCANNHLDGLPNRSRWPLVINPKTGSIEDGYHRFHTYINQGAKKVQCVWLSK